MCHALKRLLMFALCILPLAASSEELRAPDALGAPSMKAYRQILPDGSVVYSDKRIQGARIDDTIEVEPPAKGNVWTAEPGARPAMPAQTTRTPVNRVASIPQPGQRKTLDEANADVMHAEMLLEDAKKRQDAGVEALPGERTGTVSGKTRLNDAYRARQKALAQEVAAAEAALRRARAERDALEGRR